MYDRAIYVSGIVLFKEGWKHAMCHPLGLPNSPLVVFPIKAASSFTVLRFLDNVYC